MDLSYHKSLTTLINSTPARLVDLKWNFFWYKGVLLILKIWENLISYFNKFCAKIPISIDFVNYYLLFLIKKPEHFHGLAFFFKGNSDNNPEDFSFYWSSRVERFDFLLYYLLVCRLDIRCFYIVNTQDDIAF
jgi:hypothetical protein